MIFSRRSLLATLAQPLLGAGSELSCDIAIIGGSFGGCAAALAALKRGRQVVMTEETKWIGGQVTSQGVPPDEHPWIESFGAPASYRTYRRSVRQYYRDHYPLSASLRRVEQFNPGGGSVSRLTHEPRVSLAVLEAMLAPYISGGQLRVLFQAKPIAADVTGDRVRTVAVLGTGIARPVNITARYFLDSTDGGDLLPLTRTEHVTGAEAQSETGEEHAAKEAQPLNQQSFTMCFAIDYLKDENHVGDPPSEYRFWRDYIPQLQPSWPGKLFSWSMSDPVTLNPRALAFNPEQTRTVDGQPLNLWLYRRIAARDHFESGRFQSDITLVNWPQNDYWLGNLHGVTEEEAQRHLGRGKQLSLSLLHWMQTEAPRPDGKAGWPGLRLRPDVMGSEDGLALAPYVRESRRIKALQTVKEQDVTAIGRSEFMLAQNFNDSIGIGSYRIDLHPSSGGDNYIDVSSVPFQIPLGALIPQRVENLLPACKNLGVTHITNGCYRLHPVEWNIGESAGALAAFCLGKGVVPKKVRAEEKLLKEFQADLVSGGVELEWPRLTAR